VVACSDQPVSPIAVRLPPAAFRDLTLGGSVTLSTPGKPVVVETQLGKFVVVPARDEDRVASYHLDRATLALTPTSFVGTGDAPLVVKRMHGNRLVAVNSGSNDLSLLRLSESGDVQETHRAPTGGIAPADLEPAFADLIIVANRGALTGEGEGVTLLSVDARGNMTPIGGLIPTGPQPPAVAAGNDPHIVVVGRGGLVAVANSNSNDLTILNVTPAGGVTTQVASLPLGASPKALTFGGNLLYVGLRAPVFGSSQDLIATYYVPNNGSPEHLGTTNAGWFLTGLEAHGDRLFATTWSSPTTPANQLRVFDIAGKGVATFLESLILPGSPSFQQLATSPFGDDFDIAVTKFQAGTASILTAFHQ
jgi:hypothetical protein